MSNVKMPESVKEVVKKIFEKSLKYFNINCPCSNYVDSVLTLGIAVPEEEDRADLDTDIEDDYHFPFSLGYAHLFNYDSGMDDKGLFDMLSEMSGEFKAGDLSRDDVELELVPDDENRRFLVTLDSVVPTYLLDCLQSDMDLMWFMVTFGGLLYEFREVCLKEGFDTIQNFVYTGEGEVYTEQEYIDKVYAHFGIATNLE